MSIARENYERSITSILSDGSVFSRGTVSSQAGDDSGLVPEADRQQVRRLEVSQTQGRPRVDEKTERLVVQMAKENPNWGYDRMVGAMANPVRQQT